MEQHEVIAGWNNALWSAFDQVCEDRGWSTTQLAGEMGIKEATVYRYKRRRWTLDGAAALARVAGVSLPRLLIAAGVFRASVAARIGGGDGHCPGCGKYLTDCANCGESPRESLLKERKCESEK